MPRKFKVYHTHCGLLISVILVHKSQISYYLVLAAVSFVLNVMCIQVYSNQYAQHKSKVINC